MKPHSHSNNFCAPRIILYLVIGLTCCKVWLGPSPLLSTAYAQIPDSGDQRRVIIQELRKANDLLQKIHTTLSSGTIKVSIAGADKPPARRKDGKGR